MGSNQRKDIVQDRFTEITNETKSGVLGGYAQGRFLQPRFQSGHPV